MHLRPRSQDHGYAWVVLAATSCMRMLLDGFWTSLGILFVNWEIYFDVGPEKTSVIGSVFMLIIFGVAPVSSALAYRITYRWVSVGGGFVIAVCLFAVSFVSQFWHLYIVMTFLSFGMGLTYQPAWSYFIHFFNKRFAMSHMINAASAGVGFLAVPPFVEYLIASYGWRGAFQITSAIMANICVFGLLLRQPNDKKHVKKVPNEYSRTKSLCCVFLHDVAKDFDLSLFKNVRFLFQTVVNGFLLGAQMTSIVYLIPFSVSVGISPSNSSFLMFGYGGALLLMRVSPIGWIVDKKFVSASTLGGVMEILTGITIMAIPFTFRFEYLMLLAVLYGLTQGIGGCLLFMVVALSAGTKDKGPAADAWFLLFSGIGSTVFMYSFGYLIGSTGRYTSSMISCGVGVVAMGVLLLCDPCLIRWQHKIETVRKGDVKNCQTLSRIECDGNNSTDL